MTFATIKRITMFRKRTSDLPEAGSNGNVTTEKQPDVVETNFESSVGLTKSCFDLEKITGNEENKRDQQTDGASLVSTHSERHTANDQGNAEIKQDWIGFIHKKNNFFWFFWFFWYLSSITLFTTT